MMETRKHWSRKQYVIIGLVVSATMLVAVGCENPASGSDSGDDDSLEETERTLTISGNIDGWPGGTGVVTVPNVGSDTGDEGTVDDTGSFSIVVSDLEKAGLSLNAVEVFESFYNNMGASTNPVAEANTLIEAYHSDLVGEPQFSDGDIVFTVTGAEKDDELLRGFDILRVDGDDLVRRGVDENEVDTRWLYSSANVEIQAEAVLTLEEDGGGREVDVVFVWDTDFTRGWNSYSYFLPDGFDAYDLDDLLNADELRFGFSTTIDEPDNAVWEIE